MPIDAILGTVEYLQAIDGERPDGPIRHYLPEYDKYVEETIAFDPEYNLVISIIKDITDETRREQELDKERRRTAELADRVIEKQMRVAPGDRLAAGRDHSGDQDCPDPAEGYH